MYSKYTGLITCKITMRVKDRSSKKKTTTVTGYISRYKMGHQKQNGGK